MGAPEGGEHHLRSVDSRYGRIAVPDDPEDLIGKFIAHCGEWAYLETEFLAKYLPRGARVLDIGAFVGTFSMGLSQAADIDYCCMVEGNAAITPLLRANAAANIRCSNDVVDALVVDPKAPPLTEGRAAADNAGSASFAPDAEGATRISPPPNTITMAQLTGGAAPFDLIKLDVEGMELPLLASCPPLLADCRSMLWVECNEHPRSLELAELLLRTGRPLVYFAWPSHNPQNHRAAKAPIFPFACEAGLLLGASPKQLDRRLEEAGCSAREIHTLEDLRMALWHTPRWAPEDWIDMPRPELVAIASHLQLGQQRESFLRPGAPGATRRSAELSAIQALQSANFKNARLREALATTSDLLLETQTSLKRAVDQASTQRKELERICADTARAEAQAQDVQARHFAELEHMRQAQLVTSNALQALQGSLTWRIGRRLSTALGRIPLLKRSIRLAIRR